MLKASMAMAPNGTAVQRIQGRNLPHRVLVLSAMMPIMGLKNAPNMPPKKIMKEAVAGGILYTSV